MSRHSKWAQIKHQKASTDKKRGKLFSILSKRISIAAREDYNPETNVALKVAIEKAKAENMPKDTIERAIKRGSGALPGQGPIEEVVYEAYGPGGVQLIIVTATDNKNRTTSTIRHVLNQHGGSLSGAGSVTWNFERKENAFYPKTRQQCEERMKEQVDLLVEELENDEDVEQVFTNLWCFSALTLASRQQDTAL